MRELEEYIIIATMTLRDGKCISKEYADEILRDPGGFLLTHTMSSVLTEYEQREEVKKLIQRNKSGKHASGQPNANGT